MLPFPKLDFLQVLSICYVIQLLLHSFIASGSNFEKVAGYKYKYKTVHNKKSWKSISYLIAGASLPWILILSNYLTENQTGFDSQGVLKRFLITLNFSAFILLPIFFVTTHNTKAQKVFYFLSVATFILLSLFWIFIPSEAEGYFYKVATFNCFLVILNYFPAFNRLG